MTFRELVVIRILLLVARMLCTIHGVTYSREGADSLPLDEIKHLANYISVNGPKAEKA